MRPFDPIPDIGRLGYTPREAGFLALVAMHSGYFLRRHFDHYLGRRRGGLAQHFLTKAQTKRHIRVLPLTSRRFVFHVYSRILYHLCAIPGSQNQRIKGDRAIKTRLLSLDYVLDHSEQHFLRTEQQKMDYFHGALRIPQEKLPFLELVSRSGNSYRVYFPERFPVSILPGQGGESPTVSFGFVDDGIQTLEPFRRFLARHEQLLRTLPCSEIVYIAESERHFAGAGAMIARTFPVLASGQLASRECPRGVDHLMDYLEARAVLEDPYLTPTFEQSAILAEGKSIYNMAIHEHLYQSWKHHHTSEQEIRMRFREKPIRVSIRGYVIHAAFPQNGPKYRGLE